jgi:hypothetical protein
MSSRKNVGKAVLLALLVSIGLHSRAGLCAPIHLLTRTSSTDSPSLPLSEVGTVGRQYLLVQFGALPTRGGLEAAGMESVALVDSRTIVLYVPHPSMATSLAGFSPSWIGVLRAADRMTPSLSRRLATADADAVIHVLAAFFGNVTQSGVVAIAAQHGVAVEPRSGFPAHVALVIGAPASIRALAGEDAVSQLSTPPQFLMDSDLGVGWCDGAQTSLGPKAAFAVIQPGWDGTGLGSANDLRIRLRNATADRGVLLPHSLQLAVMRAAFGEWEKYVEICATATTTSNASRTLQISFETGDHGDGRPFTGPYGTVAHGFYPAPPNAESIAGDIHFDEAEAWALVPTGFNEYDLFAVALHEIGHALGMDHSDGLFSVMQPTFQRAFPGKHTLSLGDILGIRTLYKARTPASLLGATQCVLP